MDKTFKTACVFETRRYVKQNIEPKPNLGAQVMHVWVPLYSWREYRVGIMNKSKSRNREVEHRRYS